MDHISLTKAVGLIALPGGAVFTLIFGVVWILVWWRRRMATRLKPTEGVLREAGINSGEPSDYSAYYMPMGTFDYTVGGRTYTSERMSLQAAAFRDEAGALAALDYLKAGDKATVWYDPSRPERAYFTNEPPIHAGWYRYGTVVSVAVALIGAVLVAGG